MSDTPRFNSYWNSYRSGAISVEEFKEAVQNLERENAALLFLQKQDKENYQCAMKASMNIEEQLKAENAALRGALEQAEDALRHALIMSPLDPFQRGKVISAAIDVARAALYAARKEAQP